MGVKSLESKELELRVGNDNSLSQKHSLSPGGTRGTLFVEQERVYPGIRNRSGHWEETKK